MIRLYIKLDNQFLYQEVVFYILVVWEIDPATLFCWPLNHKKAYTENNSKLGFLFYIRQPDKVKC